MKKRIVCILMSALILINALNLAFIVKPSFAKNVIPSENSLEKTDTAALSKTTDKLNQAETFDNAQPPVSEEKPKVDEPSRDSEDKWNFNDTNEWSNFAYKDGNKTRLIIGVDSENHACLQNLEEIVAKHQAKIIDKVSFGGKIRAVVVELLLVSVTAFVEEVRSVELASYIEPNMKVQGLFAPNDPYWNMQWGPKKIEADWAWNTTVGDPSVLVAVVDTGIYYTHPDLTANYVALGYDWVNNDNDPIDDYGHGTHCAGIIAATINNSIGITGLAQVRIMAEKVLDSGGGGYWDWVANGIINATDCGAKIISMSLGGYGDSELVHDAVRYAYEAGVLVIAAAGNDNTNTKLYPAGYDEVVAVAATDQYDNKASFSNWGDWIELAAPGVDIYSTVPWGYESWSGTSMATPHVSGVAALIWSRYPNNTRDWVRLWLRYTADDLGDPGFDVYYGYGRVNARKAVEQTPPAHELIAYEWITPPYVEPGTSGTINATILNFGENENHVMVQLLANGTIADSAIIDFLAAGNSTTVSLTWTPTVEGLYNVTLYVVPVTGETSLENNVLWEYIYVGFPVKAVVLHSAGNIYSEIITNWQVLNSQWYLFGGTMICIDYTALNKDNITYQDIAATEADVLIISCASDPYSGWEFTDSEIDAIARYVREGHGLIVTAGTLYFMVPNNNKLAALLGLNEIVRWDATSTDLLHLLNTTHPIFKDVPNPLVFPQVGTVLPSDGRWDSNELVGGKYLALGHYQESAITAFRGLVYISPWLEVIPPYYHHHLQLLYNAITWSHYQKPEHDLVVSLKAPTRVKPGESTLLNATVSNLGRNNETDVELQMLINGALVNSVNIPELLVDSSRTLSYLWTPTVQGMYNVTAYAPPKSGEELTKNNIATKTVMVLLIAVRNTLVYSDDWYVAPSSRYVIVALNNLGINYTYYSDDPWGFAAALVSQPWDLVIVDHCNYYAMGQYWTELEEYVQKGGLLVLSTFDIDGSNSEPTTLWDTLGVRWVSDMSTPEPVYQWMPSHAIFTFPNTVGDLTSYIQGYWDSGDHVAATTGTPIAGFTTSPTEGYAAVVVGNTYSTVLFSFRPDEFRYDQNGDGKLDAIELWENAIVYLARGFEHDLAVSSEAPKFLGCGESTLLNATVSNRGLSNETNVELQLLINGTVFDSVLISELPTGASYTLRHLWTPRTAFVNYNVTAYASPVLGEDFISNNRATKMVYVSFYTRTYLQPQWIGGGVPMGWHADDGSWAYTLPFDFPFYGISYRTIYISSNGLITFIGPDSSWGNSISALAGKLAIAPAWDDWLTYDPCDIYIWQNSTHVGIRWYVRHISSSAIANFEAILSVNGVIQFNYGYNDGLTSSTIGISNGAGEILAEEATNLNYINTIVFTPPIPEHDLEVYLEAPARLAPGQSSILNATVNNLGASNETDVELQLLINETLVDSVVISELLTGSSYTFSYTWTPTVEGMYNITAYAPPVPDETLIANNLATKLVYVLTIERTFREDFSSATLDPHWQVWRYAIPAPSPPEATYQQETSYSLTDNPGYLRYYPGTMTCWGIKEPQWNGPSSPYWYYPSIHLYRVFEGTNWILETKVTYSAPYANAPNAATYVFFGDPEQGQGWKNNSIIVVASAWDAWHQVFMADNGIQKALTSLPITQYLDTFYYRIIRSGYQFTFQWSRDGITYTTAFTETMGSQIDSLPQGVGITGQAFWSDTSTYSQYDYIYVASPAEHELAVSLEAPSFLELGNSAVLNATVRNTGLNNETDVELYLLANGTVVSSAAIAELRVDESYTINCAWTPTGVGSYNITAYAAPVPEEEYVTNNVVTKWACVFFYTRLHLSHEWIGSGNPMGWHADDASWQYTLPFDFPFYGVYYRTIYISSNGLITFLGPDASCGNSMPSLAQKLAIAPAWDDWVTYDPYDIYIWQNSTSVGIRWYVRHYGSDVVANFEAILRADGVIQFNYEYNDGSVSTTIGISNGAGHILAEDLIDLNCINTIVFLPYFVIEVHDVAVTDIAVSSDTVYQGWIVGINVTVANFGDTIETFTVTLYSNSNVIATQNVPNLEPNAKLTLNFSWNTAGFPYYHNYTIKAMASIVLGEYYTENNEFTDGSVKIKMLGDVDGDGFVNAKDAIPLGDAFASSQYGPSWNLQADLNQDGYINAKDAVIMGHYFGASCP